MDRKDVFKKIEKSLKREIQKGAQRASKKMFIKFMEFLLHTRFPLLRERQQNDCSQN